MQDEQPNLLDLLIKAKDKVTIKATKTKGGPKSRHSFGIIFWDWNKGTYFVDDTGENDVLLDEKQSPAISLFHEMTHQLLRLKLIDFDVIKPTPDKVTLFKDESKFNEFYSKFSYAPNVRERAKEEWLVITVFEAQIAENLGEDVRNNHNAAPFVTESSTSTKEADTEEAKNVKKERDERFKEKKRKDGSGKKRKDPGVK